MFNPVQMQEALKNPAITGQRLGAYQTPNSPNPQVRPDDAKAEETRRAQLVQSAMGQQAAAMGDPSQTPSILAQTMMENQQLKKMLAAMQQRQQPMMVPQARGLESLPAPAVERGYAGGGIVAFNGDGPSLVPGASRMNISGRVPEDRSFFSETSPFSVGQKDEREILQEIEAKIAQGTATPSEIRRAQGIRARLLGNVAPAQPRAAVPMPSYEQDISGPDFKFPSRPVPAEVKASPTRQTATPVRQGVASLTPVENVTPTPSRADPAGLLGAAQNMAAQEQAPVGPELTQEARLRQALAARRTLMQELGLSGGAGDELRAQAEEMKAAQAKYKEQAGLAGLANVLAAYGSAPRKRAAGAAGQAAAQFVSGQQDAERKFEMDMAALKASATRADRAEKRGDLDAVMKADADQEKYIREAELQRQRLSAEEKLQQSRLLMQDKWQTMDDKTKRDISNANIRTQIQIASMPPPEFRTLQMIADKEGKSILEVIQARRGSTAAGLDEDTLVREYNKARQAHMEDRKTRDKPFPDYANWKKQYVGGATESSGQRVIDFGKI